MDVSGFRIDAVRLFEGARIQGSGALDALFKIYSEGKASSLRGEVVRIQEDGKALVRIQGAEITLSGNDARSMFLKEGMSVVFHFDRNGRVRAETFSPTLEPAKNSEPKTSGQTTPQNTPISPGSSLTSSSITSVLQAAIRGSGAQTALSPIPTISSLEAPETAAAAATAATASATLMATTPRTGKAFTLLATLFPLVVQSGRMERILDDIRSSSKPSSMVEKIAAQQGTNTETQDKDLDRGAMAIYWNMPFMDGNTIKTAKWSFEEKKESSQHQIIVEIPTKMCGSIQIQILCTGISWETLVISEEKMPKALTSMLETKYANLCECLHIIGKISFADGKDKFSKNNIEVSQS